MSKQPERDLPVVGDEFNLITERAEDGWRVVAERLQAATDRAAAREYQLRMQRTFKECPGFIGANPPDGEQKRGVVSVEPGKVLEAVEWLKKRFNVNPEVKSNLATAALEIEVITRRRGKAAPGQKRQAGSSIWKKPEQFQLAI